MAKDGSIVIRINLEAKQADKDMAGLLKTLRKFGFTAAGAASGGTAALAKARAKIKETETAVRGVARRMQEIKGSAAGAGQATSRPLVSARIHAEQTRLALGELDRQMDAIANSKRDDLSPFYKDADALDAAAGKALDADKEYQKLGARHDALLLKLRQQKAAEEQWEAAAAASSGTQSAEYIRLESRLAGLKVQLKQYRAEAADQKPPSLFKKAMDKMAKGIAGFVKKGASGAASVGKKFLSFGKIAQHIGGVTAKLGKRLGGFAKSAVSAVLNQGISGLKDLAGDFLKTNAVFSSALDTIKVNLATAFQPVFEAVMPAVNGLMAGLAKASGVMAQFTSSLFGKTYKESRAAAKALNQQAEALENTGDAADSAKGELASFDQINQISTGEESGTAGSFDSAGAPQVDMPPVLEDMIGMIQSGNWSGLGQALAGRVNAAVAGINWPGIGQSIGGFLQGAFSFAQTFLQGLDTKGVGEGIRTSINNTIQALNPDTVGGSMAGFVNRAVDLLYGFVAETKWDNLGEWFGNTVNGFFTKTEWGKMGKSISGFVLGLINTVSTFIKQTDWEEVGHSLWEMLSSIDWSGIVQNLFLLVGRAIGGLVNLLWGFIKEAVASVGKFFSDEFDAAGGNVILGLLNGIWHAIQGIGIWLYDNVIKPLVDGFCEMLGIHSPSTVFSGFGENIIQGLTGGVSGMVGSVIGVFTGLWEKIQGVFSPIADWFRNTFSGAWQAVKDVFSKGGEIFLGIKDGILDGLKFVINGLISGINTVIKVPFDGLNFALRSIKGVSIFGFKPFDWLGEIAVPQIPKLAQGAVLPPNSEFLAVLGDQKQGYNIETPVGLMRQTFEEVLARFGGGGGDIKLTANLVLEDGTLIGRTEKTISRRGRLSGCTV